MKPREDGGVVDGRLNVYGKYSNAAYGEWTLTSESNQVLRTWNALIWVSAPCVHAQYYISFLRSDNGAYRTILVRTRTRQPCWWVRRAQTWLLRSSVRMNSLGRYGIRYWRAAICRSQNQNSSCSRAARTSSAGRSCHTASSLNCHVDICSPESGLWTSWYAMLVCNICPMSPRVYPMTWLRSVVIISIAMTLNVRS